MGFEITEALLSNVYMGLHWADYTVLALYFISLIIIGINESRKIKSSGDYFMPRKFGKVMMTFFAFGAGTQSDQAVSVASKSYTDGLSGIWYQWLYLPVTPFYWLIAPIMRRFRAITTSDIFELRYDRGVAMLYAIIGTINLILSLGLMLRGSGEVLSGCTGGTVSTGWIIAVMTIIFLLYGMCGGLAAAVYTDFIQGILIIIFSFMLLPMLMKEVGGMHGLRASLAGTNLMSLVVPNGIGVFYISAIALNGLVGVIVHPSMMGNCGAGKTELEGRVGLVAGNFLKRFCTIAWSLIGVAGVVYFAGRNIEPDRIFGVTAYEFLPNIMPGLLGIFVGGVLAAVMSTCDALLLSASALFTENLYRPLNPGKSKMHYVWVGRFTCVPVVVLAIVFAYWLPGVVTGLEIYWKAGAMMGLAFWLGLFWNRTTVAGAWAATLGTLGMWWLTTQDFFIDFVADWPGAQSLGFIIENQGRSEFYLPWQMIFYLVFGLLLGIAVSLFTRPVDREKLERYYALIRTPIKPGEAIERNCHIPKDTPVPPRRNIFPGTSLEFMVPSRQSVSGFLICWLLVFAIVGLFYLIAKM